MLNSFNEITLKLKNANPKRIAVINANDLETLLSVRDAVEEKIVIPYLIGNTKDIKKVLKENNLEYQAEFINAETEEEAAKKAAEMASNNEVDILMKGLITSKNLLKAILNNKKLFNAEKLLSHVALFIPEEYGHTIFLSDAGLNINPTLKEKKIIIDNAVNCARSLGIEVPKVALLASVEEVNTDMQATMDAAILSKMNDRGQIINCIVDGPLALDNAISEKAAKTKRITGVVAGKADILIAPEINVGNSIYKTLAFFAKCPHAGIIVGANCPIVFSSRSDSFMTKYNSIALACTTKL